MYIIIDSDFACMYVLLQILLWEYVVLLMIWTTRQITIDGKSVYYNNNVDRQKNRRYPQGVVVFTYLLHAHCTFHYLLTLSLWFVQFVRLNIPHVSISAIELKKRVDVHIIDTTVNPLRNKSISYTISTVTTSVCNSLSIGSGLWR